MLERYINNFKTFIFNVIEDIKYNYVIMKLFPKFSMYVKMFSHLHTYSDNSFVVFYRDFDVPSPIYIIVLDPHSTKLFPFKILFFEVMKASEYGENKLFVFNTYYICKEEEKRPYTGLKAFTQTKTYNVAYGWSFVEPD